MAKSPSETMYCEPLSNTASIIVMVFLLSRTLNVLRVVSYIVLRASVNAQVVPLSLFSTARSQPIGMLDLLAVPCETKERKPQVTRDGSRSMASSARDRSRATHSERV
jgi:hypothetical protein